jgi:hypothetical protein
MTANLVTIEYGPLSDLLDEIVTVLKEEEELWDADEIDPAIPTARAKVEAYWETLIAEAKAQGGRIKR